MQQQQHRTTRVGLSAIACALVLRLFASPLPQYFGEALAQFDPAALLKELKTGQNVRFSSSLEGYSPDFVESSPPSLPEPTAPVPSFDQPEQIQVTNASRQQPDIAALLQQPLQWQLRGETPTVLILHSHTTESYTRHAEPYQESAGWRTLDEDYNMLSIGSRVQLLLEQAGIPTIQDRQLHDQPSYNDAYLSSREAITDYLQDYPSIQLILDLHRDAGERSYGQLRTTAVLRGEACGQLMVVVGANHPDYAQNMSLGLKLHAQLESQSPGLTRPLQLRASRFNQDLSPGCLLVEVGAAGNSHGEAMLAAEALAEAVIALSRGTR